MGRLYNWLGLSVGVNLPQMPREEKQAAYAADVTYGTNNEYGFDYLRDNMVYETVDRVQRGSSYAIVDEVDSILIDEARTPLIISGQAEDHTDLYVKINVVVPLLKKQIGEADPRTGEGVVEAGDFTVDEKAHQVFLTEEGHEKAEQILADAGLLAPGASLYDPSNIALMHHVYAALRAKHLYNRDQHYVVQNGEVIIVDEFTGRLMTGRRWSDGLHQAVEAKEGVEIQSENQTLASITFQNYFRMYGKLSGMTGTADTEAYEFNEIYGLETVIIPPNRPTQRKDELDLVYKTARERYEAVVEDIRDCYTRGQPVLVGTTSIENSELVSNLLQKANLPHQVLNAKQHAREAEIVAQAGRPNAVTIATNMAGRGTDIVLGGSVERQIQLLQADPSLAPEDVAARSKVLEDEWQGLHEQVKASGGLRIIATERHESRSGPVVLPLSAQGDAERHAGGDEQVHVEHAEDRQADDGDGQQDEAGGQQPRPRVGQLGRGADGVGGKRLLGCRGRWDEHQGGGQVGHGRVGRRVGAAGDDQRGGPGEADLERAADAVHVQAGDRPPRVGGAGRADATGVDEVEGVRGHLETLAAEAGVGRHVDDTPDGDRRHGERLGVGKDRRRFWRHRRSITPRPACGPATRRHLATGSSDGRHDHATRQNHDNAPLRWWRTPNDSENFP